MRQFVALQQRRIEERDERCFLMGQAIAMMANLWADREDHPDNFEPWEFFPNLEEPEIEFSTPGELYNFLQRQLGNDKVQKLNQRNKQHG
jgi:hypothetical protein